MSVTPTLFVGMGPPYRIRFTVTSTDTDLTTVTAAQVRFKHKGETTTWPATIESKAAGQIVVYHAFATTELERVGAHWASVELTIPSGTIFTVPTKVVVQDR